MTAYRSALEACSGLEDCVRTVARLRTEEGYMAEFAAEPDGSFLLIENHCPICAAAKTCQGFCRSELELFRAALGAGTSVMRQEHLLSDGRRCVYRVTSLESTDGRAIPLAPRVCQMTGWGHEKRFLPRRLRRRDAGAVQGLLSGGTRGDAQLGAVTRPSMLLAAAEFRANPSERLPAVSGACAR